MGTFARTLPDESYYAHLSSAETLRPFKDNIELKNSDKSISLGLSKRD